MFVYKKWIVVTIGGAIKVFGNEGRTEIKVRKEEKMKASDENDKRNCFH
jgi:hypothetical protein